MTHTYDEEILESAVNLAVRSFYPEIKQLFLFFQTEIQK
jgi:hypothetical protein